MNPISLINATIPPTLNFFSYVLSGLKLRLRDL
jgi:hypothetical protein